jgi:hypothetical protein
MLTKSLKNSSIEETNLSMFSSHINRIHETNYQLYHVKREWKKELYEGNRLKNVQKQLKCIYERNLSMVTDI